MNDIRPCFTPLDREQAFDIRRSVLCGELHLNREAAQDADDQGAYLAVLWRGEKPVGTGRLLQRGSFWVLEHVCVLPEQRRQGLGRALVEHFAAEAKRLGAAEIMAVSPAASSVFFSHCGFIQVSSQADLVLLKR